MPNHSNTAKERITPAAGLRTYLQNLRAAATAYRYGVWPLFFFFFFGNAFHTPESLPETSGRGACGPKKEMSGGYTFLHPDIINKNAAYAPFFIKWDDYYQRFYFNRDVQREENIEEWIGRFCGQPAFEDVDYLVYQSSIEELIRLRNATLDPERKTPLPYQLAGNTFAEMIVFNKCTEVIDYLMYAKKCEPYVTAGGDGWTIPERDTAAMNTLINEGLGRFGQTKSYFVKLRYTYQIVRMAHYSHNWGYTVDLYNYLFPKLDLKKPSIIYYWTLGHLAGALQKLGKYPEAAYEYARIFRHCPSKRAQAYRSWVIRNDQDWLQTLRLCRSDAEKSTLYIMRAGGSHTHAVEDMAEVYKLDPQNPQLDLLLVSEVQELEKALLRTEVTDKKYGAARGALKRQQAAQHLLDLQGFVRRALREKGLANTKLWLCMSGYLELLAGDIYAANNTFNRAEKSFDNKSEYDKQLYRQLEIWRALLEILKLDPSNEQYRDMMAFKVRSLDAFKYNRYLELFLQDWLSKRYAESKHPGKAILAAYPPKALRYNPDLIVLDDLLKLSLEEDPVLLEKAMKIDTNNEQIRAFLLETKGAYLLSLGQPEAALLTLREIKPTEEVSLTKYTPFREKVGERINREVSDSLFLNRRQIAQKILDFDFRAKAAQAVRDSSAAWYYYLIGLGYYNMSYFGYEWEVTDFYRDGYNQLRLAQGPVFPMAGSPNGNRENIDLSLAHSYFQKALELAYNPEIGARAAFMAARCRQKQWFCAPECTYRPGSKLIPVLPDAYMDEYRLLINRYPNTRFYQAVVKECKWLAAYAR
ncbi:MAG: hypothetical protein H6565_04905 [Lewinellaceae bacterium]|nr:hypothetical protein [Lewinellaceae bacterium]